jgi:hypothetical protein
MNKRLFADTILAVLAREDIMQLFLINVDMLVDGFLGEFLAIHRN